MSFSEGGGTETDSTDDDANGLGSENLLDLPHSIFHHLRVIAEMAIYGQICLNRSNMVRPVAIAASLNSGR